LEWGQGTATIGGGEEEIKFYRKTPTKPTTFFVQYLHKRGKRWDEEKKKDKTTEIGVSSSGKNQRKKKGKLVSQEFHAGKIDNTRRKRCNETMEEKGLGLKIENSYFMKTCVGPENHGPVTGKGTRKKCGGRGGKLCCALNSLGPTWAVKNDHIHLHGNTVEDTTGGELNPESVERGTCRRGGAMSLPD